ncbi:MAG: polyketide cyclase [Nitrosopumilus sp.]
MTKFTIKKTVNVKREILFNILSGFENYQKLFPQHFPSIRIRSVRNNVAIVEEHLNLDDKELVIMSKHVSQKPILHEIFVIGGDAKGTHIKQQFIEHPSGTKLIVDVDFKLKGIMKIAGLFGKNKFAQDYEKIIDDFIKIAEN